VWSGDTMYADQCVDYGVRNATTRDTGGNGNGRPVGRSGRVLVAVTRTFAARAHSAAVNTIAYRGESV
jgi:hypothetical protein